MFPDIEEAPDLESGLRVYLQGQGLISRNISALNGVTPL